MSQIEKLLKLFLVALILSLPLGQFSRIPFGGQDMGIYACDVLASLVVICGLTYLLGVKKSLRVNLPIILGFGFVAWALVTFIFNLEGVGVGNEFVSFSYWIRLAVAFLVLLVIWNLKKLSPEIVKDLPNWFVVSGIILAMAGFVQLLVFPDFGKLDPSLGWDPHYFRLNSTFFDPNFTGAFLVICLAVLGQMKIRSKISYLSFTILLLAIILTFSRSAWLMLAIVVFIYGLFKSRLTLLLAILLAFSAYFAVPRIQTRLSGVTDPADSATYRLISWRQGLTISSQNLLTGVGFNNLRYAKEASEFYDYRPGLSTHSGAGFDSSLLVVLATTGVLGLAIFLSFYLTIFIQLLMSRRLLIWGVLIALLVGSNFINSLFYAPILVLEMLILGLFVD